MSRYALLYKRRLSRQGVLSINLRKFYFFCSWGGGVVEVLASRPQLFWKSGISLPNLGRGPKFFLSPLGKEKIFFFRSPWFPTRCSGDRKFRSPLAVVGTEKIFFRSPLGKPFRSPLDLVGTEIFFRAPLDLVGIEIFEIF